MRILAILHFIRYRIFYISSKYQWLERKILGEEKKIEGPFKDLIGMVDNEVRNYCFLYGKEIYTGEGALVDLGSWLGSSVIPLASGLAENKLAFASQIHAFDAFIWYENMTISARDTLLKNKYKAGQSFVNEFQKQTEQYSSKIIVHEGNLNIATWSGEPIEYIFIDAMKDWEIARRVLQVFYPCLIAGKSIIVHEDFCHHYTSWIHLIQFRLREYFEPLQVIPESTAVVFKNIKTLPSIKELIPEKFESFTEHDIESAFDYSLSLVTDQYKPAIIAAKVMAYRHIGDYNLAKKTINKVSLSTRYFNKEMNDAKKQIEREYK
jgi:hypothetical protein